MANVDASIRVWADEATSEMMKLKIQTDKAVKKVKELEKEYDELAKKKVPSDDFAALQKKLEAVQDQIKKIEGEKESLKTIGLDVGEGWNSVLAKETIAHLKLKGIKEEMDKLARSGKDLKIGGDPEEISKIGEELDFAKREVEALKKEQQELNDVQKQTGTEAEKSSDGFKKLSEAGKKAFGAISGTVGTAVSTIGKLGGKLKNFAGNILKAAHISDIFKTLVSYTKEGFQNLEKYSGSYGESMQNLKTQTEMLKNNLAGAFLPIVTAVIPYLSMLITWLNDAAVKVGEFLAVMGGQSTFTTAKEETGQAQGNAEVGAEGTIVTFQEVEVGDISPFMENMKMAFEAGNWASIGELIGQKINTLFTGFDWGYAAATLAGGINNAFAFLQSLLAAFDFAQAGQALSDTINGFFGTIDWAMVALTLSEGVLGMFEYARTIIQGIDWAQMGTDIAEFLKNIDWGGLLLEVGQLMVSAVAAGWDLLNAYVEALLNNSQGLTVLAIIIGTITTALIAYNIATNAATVSSNLATAAIAAFGAVVNFVTSPITLVILAIGALIAIGYLIIANWDKIKEKAIEVWERIKEVVGVIAEWIDVHVCQPVMIILKAIGNFFIGILNSIIGGVESGVNWIIGAINTVINAINGLIKAGGKILSYIGIQVDFQIPNFDKVTFGRIPALAVGGIVTRPTAALIGEAGREAVLPLENNTDWMDALAEKLAGKLPQGYGGNLYVQLDGKQLASASFRYLQNEAGRIGRNFRTT